MPARMILKKNAGVAQLVEQLICNQQVGGSNPFASSIYWYDLDRPSGRFPSGQREQTVNLSVKPSEVRILPSPFNQLIFFWLATSQKGFERE